MPHVRPKLLGNTNNKREPRSHSFAASAKPTATPENEQRSTKITARGRFLSLAFLIINIGTTYTQRYTNLFHTLNANGEISKMGNSDIIWLYFNITIGGCIIYCFQSKSIFTDLTKKQLTLMVIRECLEMLAMWMNFAAVWTLGITIKKTLGSASLVASALIDALVFGKRWFLVDWTSIGLAIGAIILTVISQYDSFSTSDENVSRAFYIGCCYRVFAAVTDSVVTALTEYICKLDYPRDMTATFGVNHKFGDSMPATFFQGATGLIGIVLNILIAITLSVIPGNGTAEASNGKMTSIVDTMSKIWNSTGLCLVIMAGFFLVNVSRFLRFCTTSEVSGLAVFLIKRAATMPLFLLNIWVFRRPTTGQYLEIFDSSLWSQWLLVLAMMYGFIALPIYYEIGIAKRWRRN